MDISVVIPTYNRYDFLKRALASVYAQTYQPQEIIIVDDGSTDNTKNIQKDFPNIIYIYQKNGGVSSARNLGITNSTCNWIAFLDSDDEWLEEKLATQVKFHKSNTDILMSYTDEKWIRDSKEIKIPKKFKKIGKDIFKENLEYCNLAPSSVMLHKNLLNEVGNFDEELEVCEDYDLWLRITSRYDVSLINKKLIKKYAGHEEQLSFKHWGMDRFRVTSLEKLLKLNISNVKKKIINKTLVKKYDLLLKGAIKYDKIRDIKNYEDKLKLYE